jgi:hypothetical protein
MVSAITWNEIELIHGQRAIAHPTTPDTTTTHVGKWVYVTNWDRGVGPNFFGSLLLGGCDIVSLGCACLLLTQLHSRPMKDTPPTFRTHPPRHHHHHHHHHTLVGKWVCVTYRDRGVGPNFFGSLLLGGCDIVSLGCACLLLTQLHSRPMKDTPPVFRTHPPRHHHHPPRHHHHHTLVGKWVCVTNRDRGVDFNFLSSLLLGGCD